MTKEEYGMTQKGLDAVDQIIKSSPQYKALISEIVEDLKYLDILQDFEIDEKRAVIIEKWEEK